MLIYLCKFSKGNDKKLKYRNLLSNFYLFLDNLLIFKNYEDLRLILVRMCWSLLSSDEEGIDQER